jgi:hypothetical protein
MRSIRLTLPLLKRLNEELQETYDDWVEDAPDTWKEDGFLTDRFPISVTSEYGQNQEFGDRTTLGVDKLNWKKDRDWEKIGYLTLALATHLRCSLVWILLAC